MGSLMYYRSPSREPCAKGHGGDTIRSCSSMHYWSAIILYISFYRRNINNILKVVYCNKVMHDGESKRIDFFGSDSISIVVFFRHFEGN